ncbi:Leucine efflux protein LeuE [Paramixta manurensis]|uniref:Leucine efflux protein LeuE n=1 Tax=Paramixta manurensis TaxID=2740817 RepID=A0A6M8U7B1_9GAMM|nr:Leucine efflux protein LeuE [Erwiniaceae bacterium PD-1]
MFESLGIINLWTYLAGLLFIVLLPGPNSLYVLKTGASRGIKAGYKAATGVFLGDAILIFLAYIGVASLIKASPLLFNTVRYLGVAYLLWLGIKIFHANFLSKKPQNAAAEIHSERIFRKALILSLTNPKAILFYVSFFVQFIDYSYPHTWISYSVLALFLEAFSFIYLTVLIIGGTVLAAFFARRKALAKVGNGLIGFLFIGFAVRLATLSA